MTPANRQASCSVPLPDNVVRMPQRTALYRHFNAAGELLYVGISLSAVQRLSQHKQTAAWFAQIARVDIEWHPSRQAAEEAEKAAIRKENPRFNSVRYGAVGQQEPTAWGIRHQRSGRIDGWYRRRTDATHLLGWWRAVFPMDGFDITSPAMDEDNYLHKERALKYSDHELWATYPPDYQAGAAYDRDCA